jgi:enoyl-CoA hydratase
MIRKELIEGVALLTLCRGKVNALDLDLVVQLRQMLDTLASGKSVPAVILAGSPQVFSAGIDLKRLLAENDSWLDRYLPELSRLFLSALRFPLPLVTAITGHAIAGGCVLACTGDFRVISSRARIGIPELRVGVPFPVEGLEIMRWAATPQCFRLMISAGATWTGADAVDAALADQACEADDVLEAAVRAAKILCTVPTDVFGLTKQQIRYPVERAIETGVARFGANIARLWRAPATRRSIEKYVAERLT